MCILSPKNDAVSFDICDVNFMEFMMITEDVKEIPGHLCQGSPLRAVSFSKLCLVKRIGIGAFASCKSLREIEIPASVAVLCEWCFSYSSVSRVTFARGSCLKRIEKAAFYMCKSLKEIEIPASVEVLCEECFSNSALCRLRV